MDRELWKPSEEQVSNTNMSRYMRYLEEKRGTAFGSYEELYEWSVEERTDFWASIWEFGEVVYSRAYDTVLENPDDMLGSSWFHGARMNFAENLLRYRDEQPALIFKSENMGLDTVSITHAELYDQVARLARALRETGILPGDRVVGFMPNIPQAVIAMLAATSVGAVWSSCSPDFGFQGVLDRFGQIEPKVLFTADGYFYNGRTFDSLQKVERIREAIPSIERVIVIPYANESPDMSKLPRSIVYDDFLAKEENRDIEFEQLPFDHPLYILYTSGTTGVPKCMVHGAGGTLLQHLKELMLHTDLKREDRIFYFTTCGWMMWNWLVSSLAVGSTVLLFDGSPFYPDAGALFNFADEQEMTVFGTSAKYIAAVEKSGLTPREEFNLDSLRAMLSTGSPLSVDNFRFVYDNIKEDIMLSSISGGSDIISCFALGNPLLPVWPGELQSRGLGMSVEVFDVEERSIRGEKGELVCTASFPSQPIYFWKDENKERYRKAYFGKTNIWHHGDYAKITEHNGMMIYGRSDATLNPGGVRIGTAEIYRPVEAMDGILDSLVVGQNWEDDVRVILFVKMAPGIELDEELVKRIQSTIRANCTPRHVPAKVIAVEDIPYTISGKKVELAVKRILDGVPVLNRDALKNPGSLELYKDLPELRS